MDLIVRPNGQKVLSEGKSKGHSQLQQLEYEILSYSSLKVPEQIHSKDTYLHDDSWIHEVTCGAHNKRDIVLLHGYGGSALTFIRLFVPLSQKYRVHALDFMGMGLSGRRVFQDKLNQVQIVEYYIDAIEEWRVKSGIDKFTMVGHSFGGYMAASYSFKYPSSVDRLILISPVGTKFTDKQENDKEYEQMHQSSSFKSKMLLTLAKTVKGWQLTPSRVLNWMIFGDLLLNKIVQQRLKLEDQEKQNWKTYFKEVSKLTPNSECSFWRLFFMPGAGTTNPISAALKKSKFPFQVEFYYGDSDWMEKQTAKSLSESETPNTITYTTVHNSGHQITFDNPLLMAKYILQ